MHVKAAPPYPLIDRLQFADLCTARGIRRAVEVGTDRGFFAEAFLDRWKIGEVLVCVDTWEPYDQMPFDRTPDLLMAAIRLARFRERVRLVRLTSHAAAQYVPQSPYHAPGFVYIDGAHDHASIMHDLGAWWPIVRPGGILAGHDYTAECEPVRIAVDRFAAALGLERHVTVNAEESHSWWIDKPA